MKAIKLLVALLIIGNVAAAQTTEKISPVSEFKDGVPPEKTMKYRLNYRSKDFLINGDVGTYAFMNIPEMYASATVNRGAGQVAMLDKELDNTLANTMTSTALGNMPLSELMQDETARMQGVLVIHNGKIVLEEYMGMRELDKHSWFSASKQILGLTINILVEEGLIDLEQSVNHYIPEYNSADWKRVKVKHLLHHVSGMDYVETNANFMNPEHPLNQAVRYSLATRHEEDGPSMFELMKDVKSYMEAGVKFDYSSMNTQILGFIVERVTNMKYEEVVADRIWTKTGMESDGHYGMSAKGEPISGGFFASRLRDMARFGMLYTPSWNLVANNQIVSDAYFQKVYNNEGFTKAFEISEQGENMNKQFKGEPTHATYQWDAVFPDGDMYKAGRYGQGLYVSPKTNTVIVFVSAVHQNRVGFAGFARQLVQKHYQK
ncbi:serine hydrolase domain-containing protein [Saccharicrinis aurantiacus]|uniref:serine hydrolase domain-containing protein n=1 Tax=Saccharicrinis aurantiacus TaxID=1849719 RepID=UPI0024935D8C|nr:serine hydrolase domain-containing protein [Saccharicrinis aurantiacus]